MAVLLTFSLSFSILAYLFGLLYGASAQTPSGAPKCNITTTINLPRSNSQGQDLCSIAHTAWGMCTGNWAWGSVLMTGSYYNPPSDGCQCTPVLYNLVSSCGWCQGGNWSTWTSWTASCAASQFGQAIPLNATVPYPNWAFSVPNPGLGSTFNATVAALVGDQPESSIAPTPFSTSASASSTTTSSRISSSSTVTQSSTASPSPTAVAKTSKKGSIAGGVVVAVVSIAAACGVLMWYMRRKNRATQTDESDESDHDSPPLPAPTPSPSAMSQKPSAYYDPNDPTTFPGSPASSVTFQVGSPIRLYEPSAIQSSVAYSPVPFSPVSARSPIHPIHPGLPQL
ncbi:hypothetical protein JAAARDRAFT_42436 [Jaapia argillacea MUCL 33604]|uniref:Uncharacterized protein n=1 Tax=Jaapia argillacea MUCL 33604 TaxID=933084 RepID=A0A067PG38_9AGAM|nr:hypothetical protein JAAARDRAFT_42436 [Jaapia argillacea MUCL 33604]